MNYLRPYDAEISCLSASSITLVREKKRYAIFGSQPTAILGRSLFLMECHNDEAFHVFFFLQLLTCTSKGKSVVTIGKSVLISNIANFENDLLSWLATLAVRPRLEISGFI